MPDLLVSRDSTPAHVEVRRIRPADLPREIATFQPRPGEDDLTADLLDLYGGEADVKKIEDALRDKFRQARIDGTTIIATWSDRDSVEELDFTEAMGNIRGSPVSRSDRRSIPDGLVFCVFGQFWMRCGTGERLYCEAVRELTEPLLAWITELKQARP